MIEGQTIEFKESWREEYLKTLCAFANTDGGQFFIGIDDKGDIVGLSHSRLKKNLEDIPNQAKDKLGIVVGVHTIYEEDKEYLMIEVPKSFTPVSYNGCAYIRSGSTTQRLDIDKQSRLYAERTGLSWDCLTIDNVSISELDVYWINEFRKKGIEKGRIQPEAKNEAIDVFLDKLQLIENGHVTRAAVLLFHPNPSKYILGCDTHIGRFASDGRLLFQDMIEGPLMLQAEKVIDLIRSKYTIAPVTFEGVERVEINPFPIEAMREAVYNSLAHNDYSQMSQIQIKVYDDKIELTNSCILPIGWTLDTLKQPHRSMPMNFKIATAFYRSGFIEKWGSGIASILRICNDYGCKEPIYYQMDSRSITLMVWGLTDWSHEKVTNTPEKVTNTPEKVTNTPEKVTKMGYSNISKVEKLVIDYINCHEEYTQSDIAFALGYSRKTINAVMKRLVLKGILKKEGQTKVAKWKVSKTKISI